MKSRHPVPKRWFVVDERSKEVLWRTARKLPRGSGLLVLFHSLPKGRRARLTIKLRRLGLGHGLTIADEAAGDAVRVHNVAELRRALLQRSTLIFLSPIYPTRSHPERKPLHRMKAAAMTRASSVPVLALGGMSERRFRSLERLGFHGWAGIDAWIRT
jgi:thiamine-phosphate pyrophosphorylase